MADNDLIPGGLRDDSPPPKGLKERLYDKVKLPLWSIDLLIVLLIIALVVVVILGTR